MQVEIRAAADCASTGGACRERAEKQALKKEVQREQC